VQGPSGSQGAQGAQGSGAQGVSGVPGVPGVPGLDGDDGEPGEAGPPGSAGSAGSQGSAGAQGAQGAQGSIGAQGAQGVQGVQGAAGAQGVQGASGTAAATTAAAATVAAASAVGSSTWLVLAANSADITGLTLTTVMAITALPTGRYYFKCQLIYQASATTTGMGIAVNFTGTVTQGVWEVRHASSATTVATHAASENSTTAAGNIYEAQGSRTLNTLVGAVSVSVDTANADMIVMIEGFLVVSVSGDLQIKLEAELASLVVRAMQGSFLELLKLS